METIPLEQSKKKKLTKQVKSLKKNLKTGNIQLEDKPVNRKTIKMKKRNNKKRTTGIMYIGHIPHGFYEDEMTQYFGQFGKVLSAVVARSKKTGRSKGFGFVEFKDEDVAKIAAEAMNNYLMYNRILKCKVIPPEERKQSLFVSNSMLNPIMMRKVKYKKIRNQSIKSLNEKAYFTSVQKKVDQFKKFFNDKGIDFSYNVGSTSSKSSKIKSLNEEKSKGSQGKETDQDCVLEVDESEDEIEFKTPPQIKKIIKKSTILSSTKKSENIKKGVSPIHKASKRIDSPIKENSKSKKEIQSKSDTKSKGIGRKLEAKKKSKEPTLTTSFKQKKKLKTKSLEKGVEAFLKQKGKDNIKKTKINIS